MQDFIIDNSNRSSDILNDLEIDPYMLRNISGKFSYLARRLPDMKVYNYNGLQYVDCGRGSDTFNTVFGIPTTESDINYITDYYHQRNTPAAWWFAESTSAISPFLEQAGWKHEEDDVGMYLPLDILMNSHSKSELLRIETCTKAEHFQDFGKVLSAIFEPYNSDEAENVRAIYHSTGEHCTKLDEHLIQLVGYLGDVPVSTATLYMDDGIAGIFDIATPEIFRRRGFGSEMFNNALMLAKQKKANICVLQASPDGLNIYKKSGFKKLGRFEVWNLPGRK